MTQPTNFGVWGAAGHCHGMGCTQQQALIVAGRCERLLPRKSGPFFIGTVDDARTQGFKNEQGYSL